MHRMSLPVAIRSFKYHIPILLGVKSMVEMDMYRHIKWDEKETLQQAQIALDMMRDFHGKFDI